MILLGDILYHGPRNALPDGYSPKAAAETLNSVAAQIVACRGNCDAEVDQMVLRFPMRGDYALVYDGRAALFCTHGHIYAPVRADGTGAVEGAARPVIPPPAVFFYGHTHVSVLEKNADGTLVCNPGSMSMPKGGTAAGFAVYENRRSALFDMSGRELRSLCV